MTARSNAVPTDVSDFVRERGRALTRTAYLLTGDLGSAEDLVHNALVKALPRWRYIEHHYTYVRRSILHGYLDEQRRPKTWNLQEVSERATADDRSATIEFETRDALWWCVRQLPSRQRAVVILRYYEDLSDAEIGAALGIRQSSVRSHITRALARIRRTHLQLLGGPS